MTIDEVLKNLVTVYHNRKEILKNNGMYIPELGKFIVDGHDIRNDYKNYDFLVLIKSANRVKYKEPQFIIFISHQNTISIKRRKDGSHIFNRIGEHFVDERVPTDADEYFNFTLDNDISLSFNEVQKLLKAFKQINHTVVIRLWN